MKLIRHGVSTIMAIIERSWEKAYLGSMRDHQQEWIPLYLNGKTTPFAEMHTKTYLVRLYGDHQMGAEQHVFLVAPSQEYPDQTKESGSSRYWPNGVILTVGYDVPYNCSSTMIRLPPVPRVRVGSRPQLLQKRSRVLRLVPSRNSGEGSGAHVILDTHARDENPLLA
jgi:hypothetical protein